VTLEHELVAVHQRSLMPHAVVTDPAHVAGREPLRGVCAERQASERGCRR
jgi:hypothetical protein